MAHKTPIKRPLAGRAPLPLRRSDSRPTDRTPAVLLADGPRRTTLTFRFSTKAIVSVFVAATTLLTIANLFHQFSWFYFDNDYGLLGWKFDVSGEKNVPTWYSSFSLAVCAVLVWVVAMLEESRRSSFIGYWKALAAILLLLSLDETAALHEWSGSFLKHVPRPDFLFYGWTVFGTVFVFAVAWAYRRWFRALPSRLKRLFLVAGVLFSGGGVGMEMVNASYASHHGAHNLTYALMTAVEELAEMSGVLVFIYALSSHLCANLKAVRVRCVGRVSDRAIHGPAAQVSRTARSARSRLRAEHAILPPHLADS